MDWQTPAAAAVVIITLTIFLVKLAKPMKKKSGCGHSWGCGSKPHDHKP